jgi:hypothetical protein
MKIIPPAIAPVIIPNPLIPKNIIWNAFSYKIKYA